MEIIFFEKPGCINNTRQKAMLLEAGHKIISCSLLTYEWDKEELYSFFEGLAVKDWFNPTAPRIKNGEVIPDKMDKESALRAMLKDPYLIRRPLIEVAGKKACGFDNILIQSLLGNKDVAHLLTCPNTNNQDCN